MPNPRRILISRTDAIGDVVLTLPLVTVLKQRFPDAYLGFLGKSYTRPVVECCSAVDEFLDVDDFLGQQVRLIRQDWDAVIHVFPRKDIALKAWLAGIPLRIGTSNRPYHWLTCNKLILLSRKNSELHEAQLNLRLLDGLGLQEERSQAELGKMYSFDRIPALPKELNELLEPGKTHVILHPKSQGSAREWGLDHYRLLVQLLPKDRFQIFISGTAAEAASLRPLLSAVGDAVTDITGKMSLSMFIAFIARCDAIVAASTGPLHIAAALGKQAIGIYPPIRPMHAGRWGPLGPRAIALSLQKDCSDCRRSPGSCSCIRKIAAATVAEQLMNKKNELASEVT